VSETEFVGVLASAAADAHRTVKFLEKSGAAKDHPAIATIPETSYLKCIICTV
jgi:23S rRNA (cytosine1962-C5)-methyltransferase